jgi:hypothetical protein
VLPTARRREDQQSEYPEDSVTVMRASGVVGALGVDGGGIPLMNELVRFSK